MKILNSTILNDDSQVHMTRVQDLDSTSELNDESLMFITKYISDNAYSGMKITVGTFQNKMYEAINNSFKVDYWWSHLTPKNSSEATHSSTSPYKEMINYINDKLTVDGVLKELSGDLLVKNFTDTLTLQTSDFVEHVNYDFELIRKFMTKMSIDTWSQMDTLASEISNLDCYFDKNMVVTTHKLANDNTIEVTHQSVNSANVDQDYCQMSISDGNKLSNEWVVPKSGNLVIYGWLDSSSALNNKAIPSSYCAIEAKITTSGSESWEIIGVCSVTPAKNITYVGFNLLVHEGLTIRARTGFTVGAKSGQYSNEQDGCDTLANSTPNGFKCQVFSNKASEENIA